MKKNIDNKFYVYRFRLYPNAEQIAYLDEQMSYNRFVYNFFLERATSLYKNYGVKTNYHSNSAILPLLKKGFPFLLNANSQSLQASLKALDTDFPDCGYVYKDLKLSERAWICPQCGALHDRDVNASINLFLEGLNLTVGQGLPELTPAEYAPAGCQNIGISRHTMRQEACAFRRR